MKKTLMAVLITLTLLASLVPVAASDNLQGEMDYQFLLEVAEFIRENGYYSDTEDDPIARALISLLQEDPTAWQVLLYHMLESYDERSMFIPGYYLTGLQTSGYVGVGVTITIGEEEMTVSDMHAQGSAYRSGMQVGDIIQAVDGVPAAEYEDLQVLADSLRGEEGTFVTVDVQRDGQPIRFVLERVYLGEREFSFRLLEDGVYYMKWKNFKTPEIMEEFYESLEEMEALECRALVLDLRGNTGGLLSMAYDIVNALVPEEVPYLKLIHREGDELVEEIIETNGTGVDLEQIIVLVDGETASASEIIITGLCDTGYAISIGTQTYGKGTAQYEVGLTDDSLIILTSYHIESVTKGSYDRVGIEPTYRVDNYTEANPEAPLRLSEKSLSYGNCSDDAQRLNEALIALGYLRLEHKVYMLGEATQAALDNLRQNHGMEQSPGLDAQTAQLINRLLDEGGALDMQVDAQLDMALEFARVAIS